MCTLHKADMQAVLFALEGMITDVFKEGKTFVWATWVTQQIGISSKGAVTGERL